MIEKLISVSVQWPYRVITAVAFISVITLIGIKDLALDALPEITDPQAMVEIVWEAPTERLDL